MLTLKASPRERNKEMAAIRGLLMAANLSAVKADYH
jgi:hypothetical protein